MMIHELDSIWMPTKVNFQNTIGLGDLITIENGWIITADYASHKVIGIYSDKPVGECGNQMMMVTDVITNEPLMIEL